MYVWAVCAIAAGKMQFYFAFVAQTCASFQVDGSDVFFLAGVLNNTCFIELNDILFLLLVLEVSYVEITYS